MTDSPLQSFVDALGDAAQTERSRYHVTLGDLIETLHGLDADRPVVFEDGQAPGEFKSYRGFYDDLALSAGDVETTAAELLAQARGANGEDFMGYKGGQFTMDEQTPLWRAEWGESGSALISIDTTAESIVLVTKDG